MKTIVRDANTNPTCIPAAVLSDVEDDGIADGNGLKVDRSMGGLAI